MVTINQARSSNVRIAETFPNGLVAVFVGGTSGVGEYTLKALAKYAHNVTLRVYIVGRSQEAANRIVKECQQIQASGKFEFLKADVSLLNTVDDVCRQIKSKETAINILFESQGAMAFSKTTAEGLNLPAALALHGRTRIILNLLPLLQKAASLRRVVSVMAASYEGDIDLDNILAIGFPLQKWRNQFSAMHTLLLEECARRAPDVSFIHTVPGVVKSGIMREMEPTFGLRLIVAITGVLAPLINTSPDDCAERHVFFATSATYPPLKGDLGITGVPSLQDVGVARGSNGQSGCGMYTLAFKGEGAGPKTEAVLDRFRQDGTAEKIWQYILADYEKLTGKESIS